MWHGSLLALCPRGARSRVRTGPCTIRIYVYATREGERIRVCMCVYVLVRERERERYVRALTARSRMRGGKKSLSYLRATNRRDRGPYVSPFSCTHVRACVSLSARDEGLHTTGAATDQTGIQIQGREKRERREQDTTISRGENEEGGRAREG